MNRCAEHRWPRLLALLLASTLFAGCAGLRKTDDAPTSAPDTGDTATEEPAPDLGDPETRFAEALNLMRTRQTDDAIAAFAALATDFPEFSGPHTNLGILHAQAGRRGEAIDAFERAVELNPDNVVAHNWLGGLHRESGDFESARAAFEAALAIDAGYAAARLNLGLLYDDQLKQPAEALTQYREYYRITGGEDLRVLPWIGEIEAQQAAQAEAEAQALAEEREVK